MYKPVLSIDVSKSKSCAAAFLNHGEPFLKPFTFKHSPEDTFSLINHLKQLEDKTGVKPEVVLEATGNYSKPISSFFEQSGYNVVILNPLQTHQQKAKSIRKVKTDPIDANRIAQVYYLNDCMPGSPLQDQLEDLRNLCRQYDRLNSLYTETNLRMQDILNLLFPNYNKVFNDTCCKSSLDILSAYPSPCDVLAADMNHLASIIKKAAKGHSMEWCRSKAELLVKTARESLPSNKAQQSNIRVLKDYIRILLTHQEALAGLRAQIIEQASLSPAYFLLRSIPGVGELTAATILS